MTLKDIIHFIKTKWIHNLTFSNFIKHFKKLPVYILLSILLVVYGIYKILTWLILKLVNNTFVLGKRVTYGILKPCYRCSFGKSREAVLHITDRRGVRVITKDNSMYIRKGECLGYDKCGKCFEQIINKSESLPCVWKKISIT